MILLSYFNQSLCNWPGFLKNQVKTSQIRNKPSDFRRKRCSSRIQLSFETVCSNKIFTEDASFTTTNDGGEIIIWVDI